MKIGTLVRSTVLATLAFMTVAPLSADDHRRGRHGRYGKYDKHAHKHRGNSYRGGYYGRPAYYAPPPVYYAPPRRWARPVVVVERPVYYEPYYYQPPVIVAPPPTFGINVVIR